MGWHCVQLTYELRSPLHVGYHKVGNVQRTRYYLPARNLWAAVTERLTRCGFSAAGVSEGNYQDIGTWVQNHCAFSYFFVSDGQGDLLFPHFMEGGLCYGRLAQAEFERRYLGSHVTTALDAATTSAESGSLHEVEFIAPYDSEGQGTCLRGWAFLDETATGKLGDKSWREWLGELQVGGERRYGFGRLRLSADGWREVSEVEGYRVRLDGDDLRPQIEVAKGKPLLAHTLARDIRARGMIEPLVGRETGRDSRSFGRTLTPVGVCWVPGSIVEQGGWLTLGETGIWGA